MGPWVVPSDWTGKKGGENDMEEKVRQGKAKAPCIQKDPCSRVPKLE